MCETQPWSYCMQSIHLCHSKPFARSFKMARLHKWGELGYPSYSRTIIESQARWTWCKVQTGINRSWLQTILNLNYLKNKLLSKMLKCLTVSSGSYEKSDLDIGCLIVHLSRGSHWKGCLRWRVRGMEKQIISWLCGSAISNTMAMRFHVAQPSATSRHFTPMLTGVGMCSACMAHVWFSCRDEWTVKRRQTMWFLHAIRNEQSWHLQPLRLQALLEGGCYRKPNQIGSDKITILPLRAEIFVLKESRVFSSPRATALVPCFIKWL